MKQLLSVYIFIAFLVAGYSIFTTSERDSFGKDHFTVGFMWPVELFNYVFEPEVDADSIDDLIDSVVDIIESRDSYNEQYLAAVSFNWVVLLDYVENKPGLTRSEVDDLLSKSRKSDFATYLALDERTPERLAKKIDGFNFDELVEQGELSYRKVVKISKERSSVGILNPCVEGLINAYREELGPNSIIKYDQFQEFNEMCGLPREEW